MWEFLNSSFGLLISGFAFTGIVGAVLNSAIQTRVWERQKKHELLLSSLSEGKDLFDEISELLSKRSFGLLTVYWALQENRPEDEVKVIWDEYYQSVRMWNQKLRSFRFKTEAIAGADSANRLLDYDDVASSETPTSIHYKLRRAHLTVKGIVFDTSGTLHHDSMKDAGIQLDDIQNEIEDFLRNISNTLLYSGQTLKSLTS